MILVVEGDGHHSHASHQQEVHVVLFLRCGRRQSSMLFTCKDAHNNSEWKKRKCTVIEPQCVNDYSHSPCFACPARHPSSAQLFMMGEQSKTPLERWIWHYNEKLMNDLVRRLLYCNLRYIVAASWYSFQHVQNFRTYSTVLCCKLVSSKTKKRKKRKRTQCTRTFMLGVCVAGMYVAT